MRLNLDTNKLYSIDEVANYFSVSAQTVKAWIKQGKLKAFKAGRSYRLTANALQYFVDSNN